MEDNPCGTLSKSKLMDMYSGVLSKHKANNFIDEIFDKYDTDHDGTINFKVSERINFNLTKKYLSFCVTNDWTDILMKSHFHTYIIAIQDGSWLCLIF